MCSHDVHMLLTGLQKRTASSPVISKAQSKSRLHLGKTTHHKNTGVFWGRFLQFGALYYMLHTMRQSKKDHGLETVEEFQNDRNCDYPISETNKTSTLRFHAYV